MMRPMELKIWKVGISLIFVSLSLLQLARTTLINRSASFSTFFSIFYLKKCNKRSLESHTFQKFCINSAHALFMELLIMDSLNRSNAFFKSTKYNQPGRANFHDPSKTFVREKTLSGQYGNHTVSPGSKAQLFF